MSNEKTITMNHHIGICDNFILKQDCEAVINYYNEQVDFGRAYQRLQSEKASLDEKQDTAVNVNGLKKYLKNCRQEGGDVQNRIHKLNLPLNM